MDEVVAATVVYGEDGEELQNVPEVVLTSSETPRQFEGERCGWTVVAPESTAYTNLSGQETPAATLWPAWRVSSPLSGWTTRTRENNDRRGRARTGCLCGGRGRKPGRAVNRMAYDVNDRPFSVKTKGLLQRYTQTQPPTTYKFKPVSASSKT